MFLDRKELCVLRKVRLYDLRNGAIRELSGHTDVVNCVRFVGEDLAVSGSGGGNILVHELTSGRLLYGLSATKHGGVNCIELTENSHALITAGDDFTPIKFNFDDSDFVYM